MPITKEEKQLTILNAKKEMLFSRLQLIYNASKNIDSEVKLNNFKVRYQSLEQTKTEFSDILDRINDLKLTIDPEALPDFGALNTFDEVYCHIQLIAKEVINSPSSRTRGPETSSRPTLKLPELALPTFSGDFRDWPIFYECFKSLIHDNNELTDIDKVNFLVGKLSGPAKTICHGLPPVGSNYSIIWNALIEKYQDKRKLANSYLEKMFEFKTLSTESASALNSFLDNFDQSVAALRKLDIQDLLDYVLAYIALSKLDPITRRNFETTRQNTNLPSYNEIIKYVKLQAHALGSLSSKNSSNSRIPNSSHSKVKSLQSFVVSKGNDNLKRCPACSQFVDHALYRCSKFLTLTPNERYDIARSNHYCLNCLSMHKIANCKSKINCAKCHSRHHSLLHFQTNSPSTNSNNSSNAANTSAVPKANNNTNQNNETSVIANVTNLCSTTAGSFCDTTVLLSTVVVDVFDSNGKLTQLRFLIDSASQANFITRRCCRNLKLSIKNIHMSVCGLGNIANKVEGMTHLVFTSRVNSHQSYAVDLFIVEKICNQMPNVEVNRESLLFLEKLPLADCTFHKPGEIDGILGADIFAVIAGTNKINGPLGFPTALETSLGYIVLGKVPVEQSSNNSLAYCTFIDSSVESLLRKFWELEEISLPNINKDDAECEKIFNSTTKRDSTGRYTVALPFKKDPSCLGESYSIAKKRFITLEKKLEASLTFRQSYNDAMLDYFAQNHISKISAHEPLHPGYYIPHHGVLKLDSSSTQLRIVFDASCKTHSSYSLNDILYVGAKLQMDIFAMLLKFRLFPIAMVADIRQMYRQINICDSHKCYQRLLWRFSPEDPISIYQINTVAFGITSSPYLALRTLRQLASDESSSFPLACKSIVEDMYVDDYCVSVLNVHQAKQLCSEMIDLCKAGGFDLVKWSSNSKTLLAQIPEEKRLPRIISFDDGLKVLGLQWNPTSDVFFYKINSLDSNICNKRKILSTIARLFDPLGIVAPVILVAKLLIQELWTLNLSWDESPPLHIREIWNQFIHELPLIAELKVPRYLGIVSNSKNILIGFADASQKAYGAVLYLRTSVNNKVEVNLICSKSKVAPLKTISIPRLELCAAHLLAKLIHTVRSHWESRIHLDQVYTLSDSTVTLSWIHSSPHRWKTFVANRVTKIHELLPSVKWFHVNSDMNSADIVSKGQTPKQLVDNLLWLSGPEWLKGDTESWPVRAWSHSQNSTQLEEKVVSCVVAKNVENNPIFTLIEKSSKWHKLLRIMVYILRFCKILKTKSHILSSDLQKAEEILISLVQRKHFYSIIDSLMNNKECPSSLRKLRPFMHGNLLRVGGRLVNSDLDFSQRHPLLLPKNDHLVELLVDHIHIKNFHTGPSLVLALIRQHYWILAARNIIRKRIQACNVCFKFRPKSTFPLMADLPACRVREAKPFVHTGTDYCGPIHITVSRRRGQKTQKAYICIFICLVTKAVHLELVSDLSTNSFLLALKRFLGRRGPCSVFYSDCGTNYIGAKASLDALYKLLTSSEYIECFHNELAERKIEWRFNPPYSPHFGGIWEANIKAVKTHLLKVIGVQILTYEELQTLLCSIESILNSRPLCALSSDPSDPQALTPAHFLHLTPLKFLPVQDLPQTPINRLDRYQLLDRMIQTFWRRWHLEYLTSLQVREKWNATSANITPGTIVLIKQENVQPLQWPLGVVEEVFPAVDGIIRVVSIRTKHGIWKRPVVKICPLPTQ